MGEAIDVGGRPFTISGDIASRPVSAGSPQPHLSLVVGESRTSSSCSNNKSGASSEGPSRGSEFSVSARE